VPADLVEVLRRKFIKKSLGTSVLMVAQARAIAVNVQCLSTFATVRERLMPRKPSAKPPSNDDTSVRFDYIIRLPDGLFIEANGPEDHARAMEVVQTLPALLVGRVATEPSISPSVVTDGIGLGKSVQDWVLTLDGTVKKKTEIIMRCAIDGFVEGRENMRLADVRRTDVSAWIQKLRNSGIQTPTIASKMSYLTRFFNWAMGAGHYTQNDNPARNQVKYSKREKNLRKQYSWRPLTIDEIGLLYAPSNFESLSRAKRWAALLILYTGARVSEIAQLAVSDVVETESVITLHVTDEKKGQSLKNAGSDRLVPVHPDLVALGFMSYVAQLRELGEDWIFPTSKVNTINGRGNSFSTAFSRHIQKVLPRPEDDRKVGFHSLRKSVIQRMQDGRVREEHRMQYSGHEQDDVHHTTYSRLYTPVELATEIHPTLKFGLDIPGLAEILQIDPPRRRRHRRNADPLD
jgi:integrase